MAEPVKKLSRTQRILASQTPLAVARRAKAAQAENPGKPIPSPVPPTQDEQDEVLTGKSKFRAPEQQASNSQIQVEKKIGRPTGYSEELALRICEYVAQGNPFTPAKLKEAALPPPSMIFRWLEKHDTFRERYARAREIQATIYADEILTIADTCEDANKARLQVDARKWHAAKTAPKVWGDKQMVDVSTTINVAVAHADTLLRLAERARQPSSDAIEVEYKEVTQ